MYPCTCCLLHWRTHGSLTLTEAGDGGRCRKRQVLGGCCRLLQEQKDHFLVLRGKVCLWQHLIDLWYLLVIWMLHLIFLHSSMVMPEPRWLEIITEVPWRPEEWTAALTQTVPLWSQCRTVIHVLMQLFFWLLSWPWSTKYITLFGVSHKYESKMNFFKEKFYENCQIIHAGEHEKKNEMELILWQSSRKSLWKQC